MALTLSRLSAVIIPLLILVSLNISAQDSTQAEREEMYRRYLDFPKYVTGGKVEPHWMADGNSFWYAEGAPENTIIWKVDPVENTKKPLFDTVRVRTALATVLGHERCARVDPTPFNSGQDRG